MKKIILTAASILAFCGNFFAKADSLNYGLVGDLGLALSGVQVESKGASSSFFWNPQATIGMDFGEDGQEMIGAYFNLGFGGRSFNAEDKSVEVNAKGVTFGTGVKYTPFYFDGGSIYMKGGVDGYLNIMQEVKGTLQGNELSSINAAARLEVGVGILDDVLSLGLGGRYYFMNLAKKKGTNIGSGQIDAGAFIGLNIAKLIE